MVMQTLFGSSSPPPTSLSPAGWSYRYSSGHVLGQASKKPAAAALKKPAAATGDAIDGGHISRKCVSTVTAPELMNFDFTVFEFAGKTALCHLLSAAALA